MARPDVAPGGRGALADLAVSDALPVMFVAASMRLPDHQGRELRLMMLRSLQHEHAALWTSVVRRAHDRARC